MPRLAVGRALLPSRSIVDVEEERRFYWEALMQAWRVPARWAQREHYFPGCNPCSLSRAHLPTLRASRYLLTLKSDGVRYALFLTMRREGGAVALLVDRSRTMYEIEVVAPEDYFVKGTVLEGELVWQQPDEHRLLFLVFDAVCLKGESLLHLPFEARLAAATKCSYRSDELADAADADVLETDAVVVAQYEPTVRMRPKRFVEREHAARLWAERGDAEHRVDGLILQRADARYTYGTAVTEVFKWKDHSTVDLAGPAHALRCADGPLGDCIGERRVVVVPSRIPSEEGTVTEYLVTVDEPTQEVRFFAVRSRPDKRNLPNGARVVAATVQDVVEAIDPREIAEEREA